MKCIFNNVWIYMKYANDFRIECMFMMKKNHFILSLHDTMTHIPIVCTMNF